MGCCGNKRREWSRKRGRSTTETGEPEGARERSPKIFEYTGGRSLKIRGVTTGRIYYFRFPGYVLEVPYEDAFAMMAEADLKVRADG